MRKILLLCNYPNEKSDVLQVADLPSRKCAPSEESIDIILRFAATYKTTSL